MKYNCYRVLDYQHEFKRMCEASESCDDCPLNHDCSGEISQKRIYIVQKWSDEHPEETMLEHFKKLFPNAPYYTYDVPRVCPKSLGWVDEKTCDKLYCEECWNEPYEENISKQLFYNNMKGTI